MLNTTAGGKAAARDLAKLAHEQSSYRHASTPQAALHAQHDSLCMAQQLAFEHGM